MSGKTWVHSIWERGIFKRRNWSLTSILLLVVGDVPLYTWYVLLILVTVLFPSLSVMIRDELSILSGFLAAVSVAKWWQAVVSYAGRSIESQAESDEHLTAGIAANLVVLYEKL